MPRHRASILTLVASLVALCSAGAAGETLRLSPGGSIRLISLGQMSFSAELITVRCNVTLSGSLTASSFSTARGTNVGSITSATFSGCSNGTITPLVEARSPWNIIYETVEGRFPEGVTGHTLRLERVRFLGTVPSFASCLYTGEWGTELRTTYDRFEEGDLTSRTGLLTMLTEQERYSSITRLSGAFNCPTTPLASGTLRLEPQQRVEQLNTRFQISLPPVILYEAFPQGRIVQLINHSPIRTIKFERAYTIPNTPLFIPQYENAGQCGFVIILTPGNSCNILITFTGPPPAFAELGVDIIDSNASPAVTGELTAP